MASLASETKGAIFTLAENMATARYESIPAQVAEVTKLDILDSLGVALAASGLAPVCKKVVELTKEIGGKEESTIIGYGGKVPSYMAAFANAALVHALNYDDYCDPLIVHFACSIFPSAFAVAERVGKVSGKELITAYTLSMDFEGRLIRALEIKKPRDWNYYGWILAQVFGYFGATAVAGRLFGLEKNQLLSALGLAYSQIGGGKQLMVGGGADKGIYPSYMAKAGVLSALMAEKGIAGPQDSLEGAAGLYRVYFHGEYDPAPLTADLGKSFIGPGFYQFPCCGAAHFCIELALQMVEEYKIHHGDIESIMVSAGPKLQRLLEPLEIRRNPRMMTEAQYSVPYTVAIALTKGKPRMQHFTSDAIKDPEVLRISNKVSYRPDPECDLRFGTGAMAAKMEIKLKDGRVLHSEKKGLRHGHPQNPMSREEVIEKFRECASLSLRPLSNRNVDRVIQMVSNLEEVDDVSQIVTASMAT